MHCALAALIQHLNTINLLNLKYTPNLENMIAFPSILVFLHWLPIWNILSKKVFLLTWKVLNDLAHNTLQICLFPINLQELFTHRIQDSLSCLLYKRNQLEAEPYRARFVTSRLSMSGNYTLSFFKCRLTTHLFSRVLDVPETLPNPPFPSPLLSFLAWVPSTVCLSAILGPCGPALVLPNSFYHVLTHMFCHVHTIHTHKQTSALSISLLCFFPRFKLFFKPLLLYEIHTKHI